MGQQVRPQLGIATQRDQDEIDERRGDDAGDDDKKSRRERVREAQGNPEPCRNGRFGRAGQRGGVHGRK